MSFGFSFGDFITVIELAKKIRKDFADAPRQFEAISDEIRSLSYVLQDVDVLFAGQRLDKQQVEELGRITAGCQRLLKEVETTLGKYVELDSAPRGLAKQAKRVWKRLKWEPEDIRELRSRLGSNLALLNSFSIQLTRDNTAALFNRQDEEDRLKILNWLSPTDYGKQQSDLISRRQAGTRQWFLNSMEFQRWIQDPKQATLFCQGIPGAGKTILTAVIVDELIRRFQNNADVGISYVYFNFKQQGEQQPLKLLSSILRQLVQDLAAVPDYMRSLWNQYKLSQTRPSIDEILNLVQRVAGSFSVCYLIVDALDECQDSNGYRTIFLEEIFALQTMTGLKLLATSRPHVDIIERFKQGVSLEVRAHPEDVRMYLDGQMHRLPKHIQQNEELREKIKKAISAAVEGMFLLAVLHFDSLIDKTSVKEVKKSLERLPTGSTAYDKAYEDAMSRVNDQSKGLRSLAYKIFTWVIFAKRWLGRKELQTALAVELDTSELDPDNLPDPQQLMSVCAGLITWDKENDIFRLVHYTIQEYFMRTKNDWFPNAEAIIADVCITYLSYSEFRAKPGESMLDYRKRVEQQELHEYASVHWGYHANHAHSILEHIVQFLQKDDTLQSAGLGLITHRERWMSREKRHISLSEKPVWVAGLHLSAYFGLEDVFKALIRLGANPASKDIGGRTALSWAAMEGRESIVKLILSIESEDLDTADDFPKHTPLTYAAARGHTAIVQLLLATGKVDANSANHKDRTPLMLACMGGHESVVRLLLAADAVLLNMTREQGGEALYNAVWHGNLQIVKMLLQTKKIDADWTDVDGTTPLMLATLMGLKDSVEVLLSTDQVNPNKRSLDGQTSIALAAQNGKEKIVELLLNRNELELNGEDKKRRTPMYLAASGGHMPVVEMLLKTGKANINEPNYFGQTPLAVAAWNGHPNVVKLLLDQANVDPNKGDALGRTPLMKAIIRDSKSSAKLLLDDVKIDVDTVDILGRTASTWAADLESEEILEMLKYNMKEQRDLSVENNAKKRGPILTIYSWEDGLPLQRWCSDTN